MMKMIGILLVCLMLVSSVFVIVSNENVKANVDSSLWWNPDWTYSKKITINHNLVAENLQNFPVLIHDISFDYINHAQSDGDDFVFVSADNTTKYNHEIENYDSSSGELIAWVNMTSLSSSVDTILYMYYGNPSCGNQQNVAVTWNSNYQAVWHLKDNTSTMTKDSTINNYQGTKKAVGEPSESNGFISKAQNFDGVNDYIKHGDILDSIFTGPDAKFTISCWMKMTSFFNQACMVGKNGDSSQGENNREWLLYCIDNPTYTNNLPKFVFYVNYNLIQGWENMRMYISNTQYTTNVWYYVTTTYDATLNPENRGKIFINGTVEASTVFGFGTSSIADGSAHLSIGASIGQSESAVVCPFPGIIDEVRISKGTRSNEWIQTEYNTIYSPTTFMFIGLEQSLNQPPIANFTYTPTNPKNTSVVHFTDISTDSDGTIVSWWWDFGDHYYSDLQNPIHCYYQDGSYNVTLTVTDDKGATNTSQQTIVVSSNSAPNTPIKPSGPKRGVINKIYKYSTSTTDSELDQVYYWWDWSDGTNSGWVGPYTSGTTVTASHKWTAKSTYFVKVKAKDIHGLESGWSESLSVTIL
ncbi:MAG: DUF2341 domain-containing protein [Candidatus Thermoplasmatota archaeon]|nr:DUF2341 domain-containing protein [Candidatus Thermoplasmatota archaeon]